MFRRIFYGLRRRVKGFLVRHVALIEYCHECGVTQPVVWTAPDWLWARVADRLGDHPGSGVLCPTCFDRLATSQGYLLRWTPMVEELAAAAPSLRLTPGPTELLEI